MPLHRMDRTAMTGCIAWPVHLDSYGACGTSVYAVWPEQRPDEPMVVCCAGLSVRAVLVEEPCGPREPWRQVFPDLDDPDMEIAERSEDLLAYVLLGTTGATWALRKPGSAPEAPMHDCFDGFWSAGLDDLTDTGRAAVDALSSIYGRPPVLLTLHDT